MHGHDEHLGLLKRPSRHRPARWELLRGLELLHGESNSSRTQFQWRSASGWASWSRISNLLGYEVGWAAVRGDPKSEACDRWSAGMGSRTGLDCQCEEMR